MGESFPMRNTLGLFSGLNELGRGLGGTESEMGLGLLWLSLGRVPLVRLADVPPVTQNSAAALNMTCKNAHWKTQLEKGESR